MWAREKTARRRTGSCPDSRGCARRARGRGKRGRMPSGAVVPGWRQLQGKDGRAGPGEGLGPGCRWRGRGAADQSEPLINTWAGKIPAPGTLREDRRKRQARNAACFETVIVDLITVDKCTSHWKNTAAEIGLKWKNCLH